MWSKMQLELSTIIHQLSHCTDDLKKIGLALATPQRNCVNCSLNAIHALLKDEPVVDGMNPSFGFWQQFRQDWWCLQTTALSLSPLVLLWWEMKGCVQNSINCRERSQINTWVCKDVQIHKSCESQRTWSTRCWSRHWHHSLYHRTQNEFA